MPWRSVKSYEPGEVHSESLYHHRKFFIYGAVGASGCIAGWGGTRAFSRCPPPRRTVAPTQSTHRSCSRLSPDHPRRPNPRGRTAAPGAAGWVTRAESKTQKHTGNASESSTAEKLWLPTARASGARAASTGFLLQVSRQEGSAPRAWRSRATVWPT